MMFGPQFFFGARRVHVCVRVSAAGFSCVFLVGGLKHVVLPLEEGWALQSMGPPSSATTLT